MDKLLDKLLPNTGNSDEIVRKLIKKIISNDRLKKFVENKLSEILKRFPKLDKLARRKALKELFNKLKELQKHFPGELSLRTGKFEIKTQNAKINQIASYNFSGFYLQAREVPSIIMPEGGTEWSDFTIRSTDNRRGAKEFKLTLRNLAGPVFLAAGSLDPLAAKKGNLSFKNRNPHFFLGKFHETSPEPISFRLPSDETGLRFSPSEGDLSLLIVKNI